MLQKHHMLTVYLFKNIDTIDISEVETKQCKKIKEHIFIKKVSTSYVLQNLSVLHYEIEMSINRLIL